MQVKDTYNNQSCEHNISILEVLPEGGASVEVREWDVEENN
jgi:hypothetical protein